MEGLTYPSVAAAMIAVFLGALTQAILGTGLGLVAVPLLGLLFPARMPQVLLLVSLPLLAGVLHREHGELDREGLPWLILGRLAGIPPGIALVSWANVAALQVTFGILTLVGLFLILQRRFHVQRTAGGFTGTGVASGVMATTAGLGGPPLILLYANSSTVTLRATIAAVFLLGNTASVGAFAIVGRLHLADLALAVILLPGVGSGLWLSTRLIGRIQREPLRLAVLVAVILAALLVIMQGVSS